MRQRHRGFCFTWNNPTLDVLETTLTLDSTKAKYIIYGKEIAPQTGTPHLQGYIYFRDGKTVSNVRRKLLGAHVLVAKGTPLENKVYCSKEGNYVELGDQPLSPDDGGDMEVTRWDTAWTHAKNGLIEEIDADIRVRLYQTLKRIGVDYMPRPGPLQHVCGRPTIPYYRNLDTWQVRIG